MNNVIENRPSVQFIDDIDNLINSKNFIALCGMK